MFNCFWSYGILPYFFVITGFAQIRAYTVSSLGSIGYHIRVFQRSIRTSMLEYGYGVFSITY